MKTKSQVKLIYSKGFSTIELVVVILIIAILAGLSIPTFTRNVQKERLKATAKAAASWLEESRSKAVRQSQTCVLQVNDTNKTLSPASNSDGNNCTNISSLNLSTVVDGMQDIILCSRETSDISTLTLCNASNGVNSATTTITITPRGTVASGGLIKLYLNDDISVRCIAVTQPLGLIRQGSYNDDNTCNYNTSL